MVESSEFKVLVSGEEVVKLDINYDTKTMLRDDPRFLALKTV